VSIIIIIIAGAHSPLKNVLPSSSVLIVTNFETIKNDFFPEICVGSDRKKSSIYFAAGFHAIMNSNKSSLI
jgi:hypothetical protein